MFDKLKSKYQDLQNYIRDYNEWKNGKHIWDNVLTAQVDDEKPKIYHNCFLKAWIAYIFVNLSATAFAAILDINNTSQTMSASPALGRIEQGDANIVAGITVGTGTTPVDVADNKIETSITNGVAAGNLLFGPTSISAFKADADSEISWEISKSFHNRSGSTITVKEIALIIKISVSGGSADFLVDRTLSTNELLDGARLTVTYTIKQT